MYSVFNTRWNVNSFFTPLSKHRLLYF